MAAFHCYYQYSFSTAPEEHGGMGPCGQPGDGNLQCCGIGEKCMSNGICAYSSSWSGGSGYYIGGCTDKTMQDSRCFTNCTDQSYHQASYPNSDVVYDYNVGQWKCCSNGSDGTRNCSVPVGKTLPGVPAPLDLSFVATIVATGSSLPLATRVPILSSSSTSGTTTTGTGNARSTVTVTAAPGSSVVSSSGLSVGAAAGIGAAAVLITCAVVGLATWFILRRGGYRLRKQTKTPAPSYQALPYSPPPSNQYYSPVPEKAVPIVHAPAQELGYAARTDRHELGS